MADLEKSRSRRTLSVLLSEQISPKVYLPTIGAACAAAWAFCSFQGRKINEQLDFEDRLRYEQKTVAYLTEDGEPINSSILPKREFKRSEPFLNTAASLRMSMNSYSKNSEYFLGEGALATLVDLLDLYSVEAGHEIEVGTISSSDAEISIRTARTLHSRLREALEIADVEDRRIVLKRLSKSSEAGSLAHQITECVKPISLTREEGLALYARKDSIRQLSNMTFGQE